MVQTLHLYRAEPAVLPGYFQAETGSQRSKSNFADPDLDSTTRRFPDFKRTEQLPEASLYSGFFKMHRKTIFAGFFVFALTLTAQAPTADTRKTINSISPAELKGDLSFLASDALEGRYTPSTGLDIAAEFIASKFRAIGLRPGGGSDYFQSAAMLDRKLPHVITPLVGHDAETSITVEPSKIRIRQASAAVHIADAPVIKISELNTEKLKGLVLEGKVVLVPTPDYDAIPATDRMTVALRSRDFDRAVAASKALAMIIATKSPRPVPSSSLLVAEEAQTVAPPVAVVESPELLNALAKPNPLTISLDIPAPEDHQSTVKNVIGVIPGSDPVLKSSCILVTAHYDHIGTLETGIHLTDKKPDGTDKIFNGANDDGSGTVSVIEIARALSQLHPKRSIVFITFFGEERGLLGSTYYGNHPLFPISKTIADINLEQVGRTDSSEGSEIANASITGYDYSDVETYLEAAGKATGVTIYKDDKASDQYFVRSDNAALAERGVPAHTLTTAFEYPDYHGVGDEWQKIDYENMAKIDRTVALAVLNMANSLKAPVWNAANSKTAAFRAAQAKQR